MLTNVKTLMNDRKMCVVFVFLADIERFYIVVLNPHTENEIVQLPELEIIIIINRFIPFEQNRNHSLGFEQASTEGAFMQATFLIS